MAFSAQCPYCQKSFRTADENLGVSAKCKRCQQRFIVIPATATDEPDRQPEWDAPAVATLEAPPQETTATETPVHRDNDDPTTNEPFLPAGLVVGLAALGMILWLVPSYGRLIWLGVAVLALVGTGVVHLMVERNRRWAWIATGAASASVLLCLVLPWLLNEGWWPTRGLDADRPAALTTEGELTEVGQELIMTKMDWVKDGLRLSLESVIIAPVETFSTTSKKPGKPKLTSENVYQITLSIANDGSILQPTVKPWTFATAKLLTGEKTIPMKEFDKGYAPAGDLNPRTLNVGQRFTQTLYFPVVKSDSGFTTLELNLSDWNIEQKEALKLMIPQTDFRRTQQGVKP